MPIIVKAIELKASFNKSSEKGDSVMQAAFTTTSRTEAPRKADCRRQIWRFRPETENTAPK